MKELTDKYAGMDHTERDELQEVVKHLRLKLRKYGWNLGCEYQPSHKGTKKKGVPYMDYWLPKAVSRRARELLDDPRWEHLCRTYALLDVDRTMLLFCFYQQLMPRLEVEHTYEKEMRLWPVTYAVESRGVRLDLQRNAEDMLFTTKRIEQVQKEMDALSWPDLNPDSRVQMQKLLYDPAYLNLPVLPEYQTDKGNPGTGTKVMKRFADIPVLNWIMHYKAATKSWSYFARYKQFAVADGLVDGGVCIKPDYRQLGAGTARYSCADPNLQQVTSRESSRSLSPIDCRGPFGPRPGYVWLCVDYKGQEIRIFAYVSGEETMMQAIREGKEVHETVTNHGWGGYMNEAGISETINILGLDGSEHGKTESVVKLWQDRWGISYANGDHERIPEEQKREWVIEWLNEWDWNIIESQSSLGKKVTKNKAKMVSFTKIYGGGANAVKDLLHLTFEEAVEFLATYDSRFPRVRQYAKELQRHCKREGYLINVFGRRIECPPLIAYKCVNYMVQSSAADMIKSGMIRCHEFFRQQNLDAHIVMTIHDELVFEINKDHLTNKLIRRVQEMMEDVEGRMDIEMPTDASIVYNCWTDKQELEWKNGRYTVKEKKKA